MSEILLYYRRPDPTTWVYLSSFLTIGLYFVFHRLWSVRNLDIVLLILLAPGLLMVHEGRRRQLLERESEAVAARNSEATGLPDETPDQEIDSESEKIPAPGPTGKGTLGTESTINAVTALLGSHSVVSLVQTGGDNGGVANQAGRDQVNDDSTTGATDSGIVDSIEAGPLATGETAEENSADVELDGERQPSGATRPNGKPKPSGYTPGDIQRLGFISLFVIQAFILIRLLCDPLMVRRPLLDPNLTTGGLNFIGISLFIFMMANIVASNPRIQVTQGPELGPGYAMMNMLPHIPTRPVSDALGGSAPSSNIEMNSSQAKLAWIAKVLAILAHMAIVTGIVLIGSRHFGNVRAGVGCAMLYLLLPYTAQMTGRVDHAVPAALLLWALLTYRKPMVAGIFLGLAGGLVYYPLFLLPLWFSFYWQRGARRFAIGVVAMLAMLMLLLSLHGVDSLVEHLRQMFGLFSPNKESHELSGMWGLGWNPIWRLPVIVGFVILSVFFAIWPAQKNLGTLISGSAAVMVAAQFWHGYGGGLYIAWFLPLLLLTIFRPNLQDRVATKVVNVARAAASSRKTGREVETV